jgi:hypothetical protein
MTDYKELYENRTRQTEFFVRVLIAIAAYEGPDPMIPQNLAATAVRSELQSLEAAGFTKPPDDNN